MADFCKQFNDTTKDYVKDIPIPVTLSAMSNRSFTFVVKTPPTSWFIKNCAGIKKGASRPGHGYVGKLHVKQVFEIAQKKSKDEHLSHLSLKSLCKTIIGQANSMGVQVVDDDQPTVETIKPNAVTTTTI
eukprot:CAMPEP_0182417822 /NCGR_PEP_ID=MMETSP1167-20130531/2264_1 /TAXON_ID=2988 /ORGANISM="Mallomonas Sp, Strain CCMP3275" /LENGTH=129 /DNA_ID=CAMNT_0024591617 /DNA_START=207 /DNA_END=596 /DNA_ORIENTATION=+